LLDVRKRLLDQLHFLRIGIGLMFCRPALCKVGIDTVALPVTAAAAAATAVNVFTKKERHLGG
jgi:hypothetical protein